MPAATTPSPTSTTRSRGLAIVDAPNGSIVGYSTAPGMEAQDGDSEHSPYTRSFLQRAREPNLPIEQLFKRVRLDVNSATDGRPTPWESSSLTSEFYFFGDTAVAWRGPPDSASPIIQTASNLPSRSVREAYDYVLSEASPDYYEEFIRHYPHHPLCNRIRFLLGNWLEATAWHKGGAGEFTGVYRAFHDSYGNSPYAQAALRLQEHPEARPVDAVHAIGPDGRVRSTPAIPGQGPNRAGPSKITLPACEGIQLRCKDRRGATPATTARIPARLRTCPQRKPIRYG